MGEQHTIAGAPRAEPLPAGRVGARVRVPLSGTPGPRWSRALSAHLAAELTGHDAVGHLRLNDLVQGAEIVLEGVEAAEAVRLGPALRHAVDACNAAAAREDSEAPPPPNMPPEQTQRIAADVARSV